jgi:hypothetical protein
VRGAFFFLLAHAIGGCSLLTNLGDLKGGLDGGGGGDAFCSGTHLLCEDFDDGGWASSFVKQQSPSTTMTVENDYSVSPPYSLRVVANNSDAVGVLIGTFPSPPPTAFTCSVSVRIENYPSIYELRVSPVVLHDFTDPTLSDYEITYYEYGQNGSLDEHVGTSDGGSVDQKQGLGLSIEDDAWHEIKMTIQLAAPSSVTMEIASAGATKTLTPPATISTVSFAIGVQYSGTSSGWTAHFDNAKCDLSP